MAPALSSLVGSNLDTAISDLWQGLIGICTEFLRLDTADTRVFVEESGGSEIGVRALPTFGFDMANLKDRINYLNQGTTHCIGDLEKITLRVNAFNKCGQAERFSNPAYGIETADVGKITESLETSAGELADSIKVLEIAMRNMRQALEALPPLRVSKHFASNPDAQQSFILILRRLDELSDVSKPETCPIMACLSNLNQVILDWSLTKELNAIIRRQNLQVLTSAAQRLVDEGRMPLPKNQLLTKH